MGEAAELIDMTRQTGAHPRIGATDVLPFIPLEGVSVEECVALARRVGHEIWERYRIPVYFYEAAATRPERVNLENVRKGQFEGLREDALRDPDRSPDIGEPRLHPTAGATAVGVRKLLIAYNIHLNTSDVSIAKKIAKAIRFSSGGLRHVKAIGVDLKIARHRPGFHQSDRFRTDAAAPRVRNGQTRSRAPWLRGGGERNHRPDSAQGHRAFAPSIICNSKIFRPRECSKTAWPLAAGAADSAGTGRSARCNSQTCRRNARVRARLQQRTDEPPRTRHAEGCRRGESGSGLCRHCKYLSSGCNSKPLPGRLYFRTSVWGARLAWRLPAALWKMSTRILHIRLSRLGTRDETCSEINAIGNRADSNARIESKARQEKTDER